MSNGQCYLPDCVVDVGATPLGPLGNPVGGFGGQYGGGGYPTAFPKFAPPAPKRLPTPGPIFTPKPRPPATATSPVPPPGAPPKPPPSTPVGEPPPSEPPYSSYDPNVLSDMAAEEALKTYEARLAYWERFFTRMGPLIYAAGTDFLNLLTYSADLGPTAAEEAATVSGYLAPIMSPLSEAQLTHVAIDPTSYVAPDYLGLLDTLPAITVSASRRPGAAPALAPVLLPLGGLQPGTMPAVRGAPKAAPKPGLAPAPAFAVGPKPAVRPFLTPGLGTGTYPIVAPGSPYGLASPLFAPKPLEATQTEPGVAASPTDCQATKTGQQKKKQKKKSRNVCWRGTYEERKSGLLKWKKERIACR